MKFPFACLNCFADSSVMPIGKTKQEGATALPNFCTFSYDALKLATNGFRSSNKIGEGGFGTVYKGVLKDGTTVAVKVPSIKSTQGDREYMSEIASLSNIRHQNLVALRGACVDRDLRILVYDYVEKNCLAQMLHGAEENRAKFTWEVRRKICVGIAKGLAYILEEVKPHVVHRDIKASNILLDQDFTPKISDFGLSRLFTESISHISTRVAGTLAYIAPEYATSGHLTRKVDVYSFGVLLLEIVSGRSPIDFDPEFGEFHLVEKAWNMFNSNKLLNLIDPMLKGNFDKTEAVRFLKVGLLCVQEICGLRPKMSTAIEMMCHQTKIHDMQILRPAFISNIMQVKIVRKSGNQHQKPKDYPF